MLEWRFQSLEVAILLKLVLLFIWEAGAIKKWVYWLFAASTMASHPDFSERVMGDGSLAGVELESLEFESLFKVISKILKSFVVSDFTLLLDWFCIAEIL